MTDQILPHATYGSTPALLLNTTSSPTSNIATDSVTTVEVHPLVLLSVLDHHTRRQEGAGRVIGTLLGRRDGSKVEVTNCFAVPHAERGDEVAIGKDFNRQMLSLHLRANRKESVVGWYATALPPDDDGGDTGAKCVADTSSLIHEFYAGECRDDPVHLVVDTSLCGDGIGLKAYESTPVQVRGEPLANMFHEIRMGLKSSDCEKIVVDKMVKKSYPEFAKEGETVGKSELRVSVERLLEMLEVASEYVDRVVDGSVPADDETGMKIADTLSTVPRIRKEVFDQMFNDSLQDLLMVTYLSNITKTQLTIAEKLNAVLGG